MTDSDVSGHSTTNRRYKYDITVGWHCETFSFGFLDQLQEKVLHRITDNAAPIDFRPFLQESICILFFVCEHNVSFVREGISKLDRHSRLRLVLCVSNPNIVIKEFSPVLIRKDENDEFKQQFESVLLRKIHDVLDGCKLYDESTSPVAVKSQYPGGIKELAVYAAQFNETTIPKTVQYDENDHLYEPLGSPLGTANDKTASGRFIEATSQKPDKRGIQILDTFCLPQGNIPHLA